MKFNLFLTAALLLGSLPALAMPHAVTSSLRVDCEVPAYGIKLKLFALLSESNPQEHVELYTLSGRAEYTDYRGEDLEFTNIPVSGTYDDSRGVLRVSFRPGVPLMFNTFSNISITQFQNGYQLFTISSEGSKGPNGGSNGSLCNIEMEPKP